MNEPLDNEKPANTNDANRRKFLQRMLGAAFAAPAVATFSLNAQAHQVCNQDKALFLSFFEQFAHEHCSTTTVAPTTTAAPTTTVQVTTTLNVPWLANNDRMERLDFSFTLPTPTPRERL